MDVHTAAIPCCRQCILMYCLAIWSGDQDLHVAKIIRTDNLERLSFTLNFYEPSSQRNHEIIFSIWSKIFNNYVTCYSRAMEFLRLYRAGNIKSEFNWRFRKTVLSKCHTVLLCTVHPVYLTLFNGSIQGSVIRGLTIPPKYFWLGQCVILCVSWFQSPRKVSWQVVNIWVTRVVIATIIFKVEQTHSIERK
jgi:hypothetical protein